MIFRSSSKENIYTSTGMNWTNGWNPPEKIRLRKLLRKYIYRDELDKWLESSRKNPAPQTFEEENEAMLASHRRKPNLKNW